MPLSLFACRQTMTRTVFVLQEQCGAVQTTVAAPLWFISQPERWKRKKPGSTSQFHISRHIKIMCCKFTNEKDCLPHFGTILKIVVIEKGVKAD